MSYTAVGTACAICRLEGHQQEQVEQVEQEDQGDNAPPRVKPSPLLILLQICLLARFGRATNKMRERCKKN